MNSLLQDFRIAARQMRRSPGFALTAVLVLALGIAANVIVFGVLQAMILSPLDVPQAERVVALAPHQGGYPVFSYPEVRDVRDGSTVFSAVAADAMQTYGLEANGATRHVWGYEVSGSYFKVTGIKPLLGRLLTAADDDHPGASMAAVLSWPAWKSQFDADPNIVGKEVRIDKHPYTIVGVTPEGFYGTEKFLQPDLFVPMANQASFEETNWLDQRGQKTVFPIARLKDGITYAQAQAELDALAARISRDNPKEEAGLQIKLAHPGLIGDFLGGAARRFMAAVMVLAGVLLLAACANLGGLFAARTADRTREVAIRVAIGASRWRVVRQILVEAFLVSLCGGAVACVLSWAALTGLSRWHPPSDYPIKFLVYPQPSLIALAFLISTFAAILFGLLPLKQVFQTDPQDAMKSGNTSQSAAGRRWAFRDLLLAGQIALCCVTITAAFVSLRGLARSLNTDRGFNPNNAVLMKFDLSQAGYSGLAAENLQKELQQRALKLPGVESAAYASTTPLADPVDCPIFAQHTTDLRPSNKAFESYYFDISPSYFTTAQTPLREGRDFRLSDNAKTPLVAIVNRTFARSLFHQDHVVGRYFKNAAGALIQIVGMVDDGKYFLLSEEPQEAVFYPILQQPTSLTSLVVRHRANSSGGATNALASDLRKMVRDLDPAIPVRLSISWTKSLDFVLFPSQVATVSLGLFGAFGLLLSITGTFGLASYTVSKRMRELSIRVALGAQAKQIFEAALGRMLLLLGAGSLAGLLLGVAASKVLAAVVFQATAQDPVVLAAVCFTILITGMFSVAGPVRRALRVDPARVLREQ